MRTVETYLSNKARQIDASAIVYREDDGTFTLSRSGHEDLSLGTPFGIAKKAIALLKNTDDKKAP